MFEQLYTCLVLVAQFYCPILLLTKSYTVSPAFVHLAVEDGALEGKLSCIHCGARLGYFNWAGIQCNCGSWVTPAFQIVKSKVDISTI